MKKDNSITQYFGVNLAELLSEKILTVAPDFDYKSYIKAINKKAINLGYTQRIELHANELHNFLPEDYEASVSILISILGEENPNETGMFSSYYWVMPIGKYVELFGLNSFDTSMRAIGEITKRNTGEYAIRPFLKKYPDKSINQLLIWANSNNFHLRRLSSEGSRPKLPWSAKLDTFIDNPEPVFKILNILKEDSVKFVQRSVANNVTDYLKVNYEAARALLLDWSKSSNTSTKWIIKHATRKISI
ncbi:MAG: 3-methyladenine DNA glycosylase [Blastocatellia bacterium]|nr:3-methyladenine DNA glycosylase [Blastocatellia bacterium]